MQSDFELRFSQNHVFKGRGPYGLAALAVFALMVIGLRLLA